MNRHIQWIYFDYNTWIWCMKWLGLRYVTYSILLICCRLVYLLDKESMCVNSDMCRPFDDHSLINWEQLTLSHCNHFGCEYNDGYCSDIIKGTFKLKYILVTMLHQVSHWGILSGTAVIRSDVHSTNYPHLTVLEITRSQHGIANLISKSLLPLSIEFTMMLLPTGVLLLRHVPEADQICLVAHKPFRFHMTCFLTLCHWSVKNDQYIAYQQQWYVPKRLRGRMIDCQGGPIGQTLFTAASLDTSKICNTILKLLK